MLPEAARLAAAGAAATLVEAAAAAATPAIPNVNGGPAPPAAAAEVVLSLNVPLVPECEDDTRSRPRSSLPAALVPALALAAEPPCARGSSPSAPLLVAILRFLMLLLLDIAVPFDSFFILMLDIQRQRRCVLFHEYASTIPRGTFALSQPNQNKTNRKGCSGIPR